jgi:hypothetical protein
MANHDNLGIRLTQLNKDVLGYMDDKITNKLDNNELDKAPSIKLFNEVVGVINGLVVEVNGEEI